MNKKIIILTLLSLIFLNYSWTKAQNQIDDANLYFSFKKNNLVLNIGIEGYLLINGKKYLTEDLIYEWKIDLGNNYEKIKTYRPFLSIDEVGEQLSGLVTISTRDYNYQLEKRFYFNNKQLPKVVIAKYDKDKNIALPLNSKNLNKSEILYPLVYNFSSNNLSYVWTINDTDNYNSYLLDISSLSGEIKINLRVYNLDNLQESASDQVILNR
ncbi:MAG: hypothetical protein KatS3mg095_0076 [Candidatus Parcubacteria bacterium]|nr:MAG: hypothetical protein KatS3mg095_0076 [Candidatus Parcubacteria bacterium]